MSGERTHGPLSASSLWRISVGSWGNCCRSVRLALSVLYDEQSKELIGQSMYLMNYLLSFFCKKKKTIDTRATEANASLDDVFCSYCGRDFVIHR